MNEPIFNFGFGFGILILIVGIFTLLVPFFVFKIRNEVVKMNRKFDKLIDILSNDEASDEYENNKRLWKYKQIKICKKCGKQNKRDDPNCISCNNRFFREFDTSKDRFEEN